MEEVLLDLFGDAIPSKPSKPRKPRKPSISHIPPHRRHALAYDLAMGCFRQYLRPLVDARAGLKTQQESWQWLISNDLNSVSFIGCCLTLGIHPETMTTCITEFMRRRKAQMGRQPKLGFKQQKMLDWLRSLPLDSQSPSLNLAETAIYYDEMVEDEKVRLLMAGFEPTLSESESFNGN